MGIASMLMLSGPMFASAYLTTANARGSDGQTGAAAMDCDAVPFALVPQPPWAGAGHCTPGTAEPSLGR